MPFECPYCSNVDSAVYVLYFPNGVSAECGECGGVSSLVEPKGVQA